MIPDLKHLIRLQEIDLRIKEQENAKEQYPAATIALEEQIAAANEAKANAEARLERVLANEHDLAQQADALRETLAKSEEKVNAVQNNKEYDAVHAEIEVQRGMLTAAKAKRKHLENDIAKCRNALAEAEALVERANNELRPQIEEFKTKMSELDATIAEIAKERDEVLPNISGYILRTYDNIRTKRKNGKAVSVVTDTKACAVCFMVLRPQLYSEIRRGNDFILCENCGSMLVWGNE